MISALTGELRRVTEDRIHVQVGPLLCEMLVPAADLALLQTDVGLPQIGKRMAEQIVAELAGKCGKFATALPAGRSAIGVAVAARSQVEEDAIAALMALGERRGDAELLLDR